MNREHGIIFQGWGVRAILEGRKTQTRRVIRPQPDPHANAWVDSPEKDYWKFVETFPGQSVALGLGEWIRCPYGRPGSILWMRETWRELGSIQQANGSIPKCGSPDQILYRADGGLENGPWRSSRFMPRWASRLILRITDVRVQRVQEISEEDAQAEGIEPALPVADTRWVVGFRRAWDSINARRGYSWTVNPWVWVLTFERVSA